MKHFIFEWVAGIITIIRPEKENEIKINFAKEEEVVLLQVDLAQKQDQLKFEDTIPLGNRTNSFPHYYGDININDVSRIWHLNRGAFEMPIEVMLQAEQDPNT